MQITLNGKLPPGVTAKDIMLEILGRLTVNGGVIAGIIGRAWKIVRIASALDCSSVPCVVFQPSYTARMPAGFTFTVALMQPAPPIASAFDSSDSLAGNTSNPLVANASIIAFELLQSPDESFAPAMTRG